MACLAIFGRGPAGGLLAAPHIAAIRQDPTILRDIYTVAGINPHTPVTMGQNNFRHGGAGANDESFVCPDALCRRVLPVYLAQLDHNFPQVGLAAPALGLAHAPGAAINGRNFIHRNATNANQHRNHIFNPPVIPFAPAVHGLGAGFALYYTFGNDTFDLVMQIGGNLWVMAVARVHAAQLHWLIRAGFTLAPSMGHANCFDCVAAFGPNLQRLAPTMVNYANNLVPAHDLANMQFLCGPCNATKNAGGVPLNLPTQF